MKADGLFGGDWTQQKLDLLAKYLRAYTTIFTRNPKARFYETVYVDAFAGAGYIRRPKTAEFQEPLFEEDAQGFIKGSAIRALEVEPRFNHYLFIEKDSKKCDELRALSSMYPGRDIQIAEAEANEYLKEWCSTTDWHRTRAVVFLDPYGMEVDWSLLQRIAQTQAIDLWLLFPLGIGVMRLLPGKQAPSAAWSDRLTQILGTDEWKTAFYSQSVTRTLFGPAEFQIREADQELVGAFFLNRLAKIFPKVADKPFILRNSKNSPLYLLCFAAGNPKKAEIAVRIAQYILRS